MSAQLAVAQSTVTYSYDALGRLVATTYPGGSVTYTHDKADNRKRLVMALGSNNPPVANTDTATVATGGTIDFAVLTNDTDADSDPISLVSVGPANLGTVTPNPTGTVHYVAGATAGLDSFSYQIVDSKGAPATGTINVTVSAGCVAPVPQASSASVAYNSSGNSLPLSITGGAPTSLTITTQPSRGTATVSGSTIIYTPPSGQTGSDSLRYTATGCGVTNGPATVSITIGNPPPPTVGPVSVTVAYNSGANPVTLAPSGSWTSVALSAPAPSGGTASISNPSVASATYTPTPGFSGQDAFYYTATGPGGTSAPAAKVTVTVQPPAGPLTASINKTSYIRRAPSAGNWNTVPAVVVTPSGGTGPYAYSWSQSGDTATTIHTTTTSSSQSAQWTRPGFSNGSSWESSWICTVTDNAGGSYTLPTAVTVRIENGVLP